VSRFSRCTIIGNAPLCCAPASGDHQKWSLRFSVVNLTNKVALYNFLSTFSGTHYVTPRTFTVELGFHF
jgi:outer membrane receptor protein involved in Fe transport